MERIDFMYYKTCPHCGAHLDPGESCDCKREAAPGAANTGDGKNESAINTNTPIVQGGNGVCQEQEAIRDEDKRLLEILHDPKLQNAFFERLRELGLLESFVEAIKHG